MKANSRLANTNEIEEMTASILTRPFPRLINFCDIVNRYIDIVFKNRIDWLKTMALIVLCNMGNGTMLPKELARNLLRSNQSITKLTDALEKDGFITRERSETDRRVIHLRITLKGLAYLNEFLKDIDSADSVLRSCFTDKELAKFFAMNRKIRRAVIKEVSDKTLNIARGGNPGKVTRHISTGERF